MRLISFTAALTLLAAPAFADDGHPPLTGSLKAFHDVLSPDWHHAPGAERNARACRNVGAYVSLAREIAAGATAAQADAAAGLRDASVALGAYCASGGERNVVAGLTTLHDRFHDLMETMPKAGAARR